MLEDAVPAIRRMLTPSVIVTDLISPFLDLVSPHIRPVAQTLLSQTERKNLKKVVNTLASYNVTYKQTRGDTGYEYVRLQTGPPAHYSHLGRSRIGCERRVRTRSSIASLRRYQHASANKMCSNHTCIADQ